MGSPLGPVLSRIFMVELENTLVPILLNQFAIMTTLMLITLEKLLDI